MPLYRLENGKLNITPEIKPNDEVYFMHENKVTEGVVDSMEMKINHQISKAEWREDKTTFPTSVIYNVQLHGLGVIKVECVFLTEKELAIHLFDDKSPFIKE